MALALTAAGCHSKRRAAPSAGRPAAELTVTRDFGSAALAHARVAPGQSVLAALDGAVAVSTSDGGRFVDAIAHVHGDAGSFHGWIFFVNGLESDLGAADVTLHSGDRVWWDDRYWRDFLHVPAVVGAFPEPFVHGWGGHRPAVDVVGSAVLAGALRRDGAHVVARASRWRIVVGSDAELRADDAAYRRVVADPAGAGVTAVIRAGRVAVYNGSVFTAPARARAVVFAVGLGGTPGSGAELVVAGVDAAAARAPAAAIAARPRLLANRYAAAFDETGRLVASGGRR